MPVMTAGMIVAAVLALAVACTYLAIVAVAWSFYRLSKHATDERTSVMAGMALQAALVALFVLGAIGVRTIVGVLRDTAPPPAERAP